MGTIIFDHKKAKRFNKLIASFHVIMKNVLMRNVAMMHSHGEQQPTRHKSACNSNEVY